MPSKFEQLPIEIVLIIFQYLEAHDLVNGFGCLNSYFRSILLSPHLRVHVNIDTNDMGPQLQSNSIWSLLTFESIYSLKTQDIIRDVLVQKRAFRANPIYSSVLNRPQILVYQETITE
ncbi:unnamed protein product [Adineta steineri]|uniref:F-box domain-containing protein n=1 Tax=Adineta steineri TaxID=433720 RepID=A0A820I6T0_9BILA|nr:unnamed protein product [Adineta steineri]